MKVNTSNVSRVSLILSGCSLITGIIMILSGNLEPAGPFIIVFFLLLALGIRGYKSTRGLSYTVLIFSAVSISMFYPSVFTSVGDFQLKKLIIPLLQLIMFGMGSQMSLKDFTGVFRMPRGVLIGVGSHYIIMPLVGFGLASLFSFPPEIKAGIILIGCVPSGLASNVMSYISGANLALAVTIGAVSTLISPLMTPFLMKILGGQFIEVNFWSMMLDIMNMIILPIIAGFTFNLFVQEKETARNKVIQLVSYFVIIIVTNLIYLVSTKTGINGFAGAVLRSVTWFYFLPLATASAVRCFSKGERKWIPGVLSFISMAGIALIIAIITASGRESLLKVGLLLIVTSLLHNLTGYTFGYFAACVAGMPEKDRRTVAFEVGMQNGGLASGLALQMGKIATVGLAPAIFGPLMNITGSSLANFWRGKQADIKEKNN
ncbi:MAG TPA: bile acid:sodium symporter family protein [Bacteroidales bacterium]|nr:bile acid:sodium symporter family protein [Bacteroidales bacterium]